MYSFRVVIYMLLFISVISLINAMPTTHPETTPQTLSIPQIIILFSTFFPFFQSLSDYRQPTLFFLPSKSGPTGSKILLLKLLKKNKVLLSVCSHLFSGQAASFLKFRRRSDQHFLYIILHMIFLLCIVLAPSGL